MPAVRAGGTVTSMRLFRSIIAIATILTARSLFAESYEQCLDRALSQKDYEGAISCLRPALAASPKSYKINYQMADVFYRWGKLDSVTVYARRAVQLKDNYVEALDLLGTALLAQNNAAEAVTWFGKAQQEEGRSPSYPTAYGLGKGYAVLDSFKLATLWLSRAAEIDTSKIDPHLDLGDYYAKKQVYILAQEQFQLAINHEPMSVPWRMKLAKAYYDNSQYDSAVKVYEHILDIAPENVEVLTHLGDIYIQARQWHNAYIMYDHLSKIKPDDPEINWLTGLSAFKSRDFAEATVHLGWVINHGRRDSIGLEAARMLAQASLALKQGDKAVAAYEVIRQIDSTKMTADDYRRLGSAYLESKDTAKAFGAFEQFTLLDSTDCEICKLLGPRKMVERNYAAAITYFKLRLKRCDSALAVYKNIGLCYQVLQNNDSAAIWYRMALARKPSDGWTVEHLGLLYFQLEQRDSALDIFQRFIKTAADSATPLELASAYKYAGVIYLVKKEYTAALEELKKAVVTLKDDCDVLLWLAQSYHNLQEKEEACKYYSLVVQKNCKNAKTAREGMKMLECK